MTKLPIILTVLPNSKVKVTFFSRCNEEITNISLINQLLNPQRQAITNYPEYGRYETEVQSLSNY